jgi:CHAT domain-containing protein
MGQKSFTFGLFMVVLISSGCAASKFDGSNASLRAALLRGEIREALAYYETEAQEAEKDAAWGTAVGAYLQAADAAEFAGQLQKAIAYGEKALDIAHRTNAPVLGRANLRTLQPPPLPELSVIESLARIYQSVRDFDKARTLAKRGLALLKKNPSVEPQIRMARESSLYDALGNDHLRRGDYAKAIDNLLRAVNLRLAHLSGARALPRKVMRRTDLVENSETHVTGSLVALARAYRLSGQFDNAVDSYQDAFSYIDVGGTKEVHQQAIFSGLGEVYLQQKRFPLAIENFQKALDLADKQQHAAGISSASIGLAATVRQTGKIAEAIPYYQKAIQQTESTRSLLQSEEYRQFFFEGALSAYFDMIDTLSELGKADEAFNVSERARSRAFLDVLGSKVQLARSGTMMEHERALQARISVLRAMIADEGVDPTKASELRAELADAEQAYSGYLTQIRKESKEHASLVNVEPLKLGQVQEMLDPDVSLLEYFVNADKLYLWVVEKDRFQFLSHSIARKDLVSKVTELRETIYRFGEKERFNALSQELYRLLIEPAVPHIKGKELLIVPHDVLHYLPFQGLLSSDGRYLIEKYPIYYLSSASLLQFVKEKRKAGGEKVLAFGNPDLGDPEKNLEYAELEAKEVKAAYPESSVYIRKEATEEKSKTLSAKHDILHFATHAKLNEDDPLSSAVLLAKEDKEDGRLEVREIFGMDLKANLVVLSGCETGLGKLSTGDELVGLTRAFIYAGTPSVVASLWSVDDSSTAHLMASFYRNLKTMSKVEALRQAQLELIRGEGRSDLLARRGVGGIGKLGETVKSESRPQNPISISTSHPYFWAPFILVGDGK